MNSMKLLEGFASSPMKVHLKYEVCWLLQYDALMSSVVSEERLSLKGKMFMTTYSK
jgi:hypothetical protein